MELRIEVIERIEVIDEIDLFMKRGGQGKGYSLDEETKKHLKKRAIKLYSEGIMNRQQLADRLGISRTTLYRMEHREGDKEFEEKMGEAQQAQDDLRNDAVESKFTKRLLEGVASPIEYIFYLTNRLPERWKDKRALFQQKIVSSELNIGHSSVARDMVKKWTPEKREKFLQILNRIEGELSEFGEEKENAEENSE